MIEGLITRAGKEGLRLAPFIGIGCPGIIEPDGTIDRGAQNLPGNWESSRFNLPAALHEAIPTIGKHDTTVLLHNDAVVQGLSEAPFMRDVTHWGALTIGTGLGNARYTNRAANGKDWRPARGGDNTPESAAGRMMKPAPFAYAKARSVAHAIDLLAQDDARLRAGGQSLIATLNMRLSHPALLIDINGV